MVGSNPRPSSSARNILKIALSSNEHENTYLMDTSKPVGDACREDGTLKEASEMEWPDSPTGYNSALLSQYEDQFKNRGSRLEFPSSPSRRDTSSSELELSNSELGNNRKHKHLASNKSESDGTATEPGPEKAPKAKVRYSF